MRTQSHARRQFWLYLAIALCWAFCSIARLIKILTGQIPRDPLAWLFLVVFIVNAILYTNLCLRNRKKTKEEEG